MTHPANKLEAALAVLHASNPVDGPSGLGPVGVESARDLYRHGRYREAVELINLLHTKFASELTTIDELRLGITCVRILLQLEQALQAAEEIKRLRVRFGEDLERLHDEDYCLRALEGAALRRQGRNSEAVAVLQSVRRSLLPFPDGFATCVCLLELAPALQAAGEFADARSIAMESLVASQRFGDPVFICAALLEIAELERRSCRWLSAREAGLAALAITDKTGHRRHRRIALRQLALMSWRRGKLGDAMRDAEAVFASFDTDVDPVEYCRSLLIVVLVRIHAGQFKAANSTLSEVQTLMPGNKLDRVKLLVEQYSGDIKLELGQFEEALAVYEAGLVLAAASGSHADLGPEFRARRAECMARLGRTKEACIEAQQALREIELTGEQLARATILRQLAITLALAGSNEDARKTFEIAFDLQEDISTPYEWAKLWLAYGDWLASDSAATYRNLSAALEAYRAAFDHFERIGSEYKLGEARARIEALERVMAAENEPYAPTTGKVRPARRPRQSADLLRRSQWALDTFGVLTRGPHLLAMLEEIASVSVSDLPVLVLGESGTGKELVARGVHALSGRTGEFMAINCSAVSETMLEGEFFGFMRGAFTNAVADKPGLFEVADQGTVFLDEIGEMAPDLQSKLLRFLETGVLRRVGATRDTAVDTRIVAATNRERSALQAGDGFRSDLYYRLAHAVYELPPLRERGDDVELLLDHFLAGFSREFSRTVRLSAPARSRLLGYGWPGNVRELRSVVQKLVVAARPDGVITPRDLPAIEDSEAAATYQAEVDAGEKRRILRALEQARFVKTDAAKLLRISRTTLVGKMKRLGIEG